VGGLFRRPILYPAGAIDKFGSRCIAAEYSAAAKFFAQFWPYLAAEQRIASSWLTHFVQFMQGRRGWCSLAPLVLEALPPQRSKAQLLDRPAG